ncbi:hypothetical protein MNBD_GAMMA12-2852 [hydrothermal vent metagenome]|uniref:Cytochrome c-type biogenesis protein CcmE, heme chaperone n=1 Tax=hydrothermal vent metagenome TaxID=652676 RepID=A0A3B0YHJ3_9ZZZZ
MNILPSKEQRRERLRFVFLLVFGVGLATSLVIYSKRDDISWYITPSKIAAGKAPVSRAFRVGGIVEVGSRKRLEDGITVRFTVTDCTRKVRVQYRGVLPDMFSEGKTAVAKGTLNKQGIFVASKVMAKHDEKYIPVAVKRSLANKKACNGTIVKSVVKET